MSLTASSKWAVLCVMWIVSRSSFLCCVVHQPATAKHGTVPSFWHVWNSACMFIVRSLCNVDWQLSLIGHGVQIDEHHDLSMNTMTAVCVVTNHGYRTENSDCSTV